MLLKLVKLTGLNKKCSNWSLRDCISFTVKLITLDKMNSDIILTLNENQLPINIH